MRPRHSVGRWLAFAGLGVASVAACSSTPEPHGNPPVASASVTASASADAPPPPLPAVAQRDSSGAVVLVAKGSGLLAVRDKIGGFFPEAVTALFSLASPQPDAKAWEPDMLATLGIDPDGLVVVESYELDADAVAFEEHVAGFVSNVPDQQLGQSFLDETRAKKRGWFLSRVHLPKKGPLADTVTRLIGRMGAKPVTAPIMGASAYVSGRSVFLVREDAASVDVELAIGDAPAGAADVRMAAAALLAWKRPQVSLPAGEEMHVAIVPGLARKATFFLATQQLVGEANTRLSKPGLSEQGLAQVVGRGFRDAQSILDLDAPDQVDRYREVILVAKSSGTLELDAALAEKTASFDPPSWTTDGADVVIPGADFVFSVNGGLVYGWPMVSATPGRNPYRAGDIERWLDRGGPMVIAQMLGDFAPLAAREGIEEVEVLGQATLPFMRRFERLGIAAIAPPLDSARPLFFGLLAASATEEQAACALAKNDKGCAASDRLAIDKRTERSGFTVVRKKIGGRFVILASRVDSLLDHVKVEVAARTRPAVIATFDPPTLLADMSPRTRDRWRVDPTGWPVYAMTATMDADQRGYSILLAPKK